MIPMVGNMIIINKEHHSVISSPLVKDICYPFFCDTGVSDFVYARIFDNNEIYSLNSSADWQLLHCNEGHLVTPPLPNGIISNQRCAFMLTSRTVPEPFSQTLAAFKTVLGMDYPYFIIERYHNFYDLYVFCTGIGNEDIINFYLTQQKYIEKFKQYFLEKAKILLKEAKTNKIVVPNTMRAEIKWQNDDNNKNYSIAPNRYTVFDKHRDIIFTKKEAECLKYFSLGYNTKMAAKKMNVSHRTIEFHIKNIKDKVGYTALSSVMLFLNQLEIPLQNW